MQSLVDSAMLDSFVGLAGKQSWAARIAEIRDRATAGPRSGKAIRQRHAVELAVERMRETPGRQPSAAEFLLASHAADAVALAGELSPVGRRRLAEVLQKAIAGDGTLIPLFHLLRTAALQRSRGFTVRFSGLEEGTEFDLLLARERVEAEISCEVMSAEDGRDVHRGAWFRLADRIDPELQTWLSAHPGRYLLKMTLPQGLHGGLHATEEVPDPLAALHQRIRTLLQTRMRQDHDEAIVLRLDPLTLSSAQGEDLGLLPFLRREFGPEAHLAVTTAGGGVFVMAARAAQENGVAVAVRKRLGVTAPDRLTGTRPGIMAIFLEDTDRLEWRGLRERLELEGEARQFLTNPEAKRVVAVTFASRLELFGMKEPDAVEDGELRFRNPGHPAARIPALAPAVLSSL